MGSGGYFSAMILVSIVMLIGRLLFGGNKRQFIKLRKMMDEGDYTAALLKIKAIYKRPKGKVNDEKAKFNYQLVLLLDEVLRKYQIDPKPITLAAKEALNTQAARPGKPTIMPENQHIIDFLDAIDSEGNLPTGLPRKLQATIAYPMHETPFILPILAPKEEAQKIRTRQEIFDDMREKYQDE